MMPHPLPWTSVFFGASLLLLLLLRLDETHSFAPVPSQTNPRHCSYVTRIQGSGGHGMLDSSLCAVSKDTTSPVHDIIATTCRTAICSTIMSLVLLYSPPLLQQQQQSSTAFALELPSHTQSELAVQASSDTTAVAAATITDPTMTSSIESSKSPQDLVVGIPPLPKQEEQVSNVLQPQESPTPTVSLQAYSPIDEVWTLVNKYYIDRSFHGQDWNEVKQKYKTLEHDQSSNNNDMKLASEMVKSLGDKYSRILDAAQYAAIQKFDLIGVGVTLMPNEHKEIIVGAPPIQGSASQQAGLQVGDFVTAVNGISTSGKTAFDIIDLISDHPNAPTVTFTMKRTGPNDIAGEGSIREVTMERTFQQVNDPIKYKISEVRSDGTVVGFVKISEFNSLVKAKLEQAFGELQKQGANAIVLDLRGNPGGAFQSAVEISSLLVDNQVATYVVDSNGVELPFKTMPNRVVVDPKIPIAIWVDGGSASASEVLAGSLHDNCRAVVMGKQSFGKGLIQAVYGLKNGAGLVLTVAKYVTPNGTEIQGEGVTPDVEGGVPLNLPIVGTDTSKVDFKDVSRRLDSSMCQVPTPH